ncbi:MAG: hypothetical protein KAQ65_11695, partial [Candidatus Thorarchaeota archaeon]|nr:hypothetical protein [Candidatus Thorarchaeota archaeon]
QRVYSVRKVESAPEFDTDIKSGRTWIESSEFILEFDEFNGGISRLFDKRAQTEMIARGSTSITMDNDVGDLYRFSPSTLTSEESRITSLRSPGKISIVEEGPIRAVAEIRNSLADSEILQKVTMYHKIRRVDVDIELKFKGNNRRVRYNIPIQVFASEVHTGAQFRVEKRNVLNNRSDEYLDHGHGSFHALDWVDASGPEFGFCLTTVGLHEFEFLDGLLSTTLLRSVNHLSHGLDDQVIETPLANENDTHTYQLSLIPHVGDWKSGKVNKQSAEHRLPLIAFHLQGGVAERPLEKSLLEIQGVDLGLSCYKPTDSDSEFILRFYEINGERGMTTIKFDQNVQKVVLLDLLENEIGELESEDNSVILSVDPFSIITVKVQLS